jgi:hypothetical protein
MLGACRNAATAADKCGGLQADEGLAEAHAAREQPSKGLTLELSGARMRVRLERVVRAILSEGLLMKARQLGRYTKNLRRRGCTA